MLRSVASRVVPSQVVPSLIAIALIAGLVVTSPSSSHPAEASTVAWDAAVDITFPVAGPVTFRDDYASGRSGGRFHRATDIMAPEGAPIHAAMGGTISFITGLDGNPPSYGYMIRINGDDGRTYSYIHLGRQNRGPNDAYAPGMRRGVRVERGQWIGYNGCSGNAHCSAPHLHFEIITDVAEPAKYLPAGDNPQTRMNPYRSLISAQQRGDLPSGAFADVGARNVHRDDIIWLAEAGITKGCNPPANTRFCPDRGVSRDQMAAFLTRSLKLTATSGIRFKDVPRGSTFETDIDRLATAGITKGCNPPANDRFCPDRIVTRREMAAFMTRGYELPGGNDRFRDVPSDSTFADNISRLSNAGITKGCNPPANDRFCPTNPVTRAQMASFIRRAH